MEGVKRGLNVVSIIPARGNSVVMPGKNLRTLHGRPLLSWTVEQSLNSKLVSRTIVSTNDENIADVARVHGAEVIMRPEELCKDHSPSEEALLHVVEELEKKGEAADVIVFLQCTSPIRRKNDIDNAIKKFLENDYDSLFSCGRGDHILWQVNGKDIKPLNDKISEERFKEFFMKTQVVENGSIYVMKTSSLKTRKNRHGEKIGVYDMSKESALEVDDEFDLWMAEKIMRGWLNNE